MKFKFILLTITTLVLFSCSSSLDKSEVPETILESFTNKYSDTLDVKWNKEGETYHAEFTEGEETISVSQNDKGEWVKGKTSHEQDDEDVETIIHTLPIN